MVEENTGYLPVDDRIDAIQILATDKLVMKEAGFLEIFVNNDAQTPVYYDNMTVTRSGGSAMEVNAYYPYGMIIPNLSVTATYPGEYNAYKYNAKELQTELGLNWHDYGARMLNGERWFVPDPMSEKYYNISPYAYALNNPIRFIDPNGMWVDDYYNEFGNYLYTDNKTTDNIRIIKQKDWSQIESKHGEALLDRKHSNLSLQNDLDTKSVSIEDTRLKAEAYSNIFTNILSKMPDVDLNLMYNGQVSVYTKESAFRLKDQYNQPDKSLDMNASANPSWYGKIRVTAAIDFRQGGNLYVYSTVSNVQNLLGAHEFIGHGIKGWDDLTNSHYKAYEFQMEHSTWKGTTEAFKTHILKIYSDYIYPIKR